MRAKGAHETLERRFVLPAHLVLRSLVSEARGATDTRSSVRQRGRGGEAETRGMRERKKLGQIRERIIRTGTLSEERRGTEGERMEDDDQDEERRMQLRNAGRERMGKERIPRRGRNGISEAFSGITWRRRTGRTVRGSYDFSPRIRIPDLEPLQSSPTQLTRAPGVHCA